MAALISIEDPKKTLPKMDFRRAALRLVCETTGAPEGLALSEEDWMELAVRLSRNNHHSEALGLLYEYAIAAAAWMRLQRLS